MTSPLTADKLVTALKTEGVKIVGHDGWRTHNRNHKGAWGPVNGTMVHHTGPYSSESQIMEYCYRGSTALPGPLATGVIGRTGTVYLIGNGRANHAGGGDARVLAAVTEENYGAAPSSPRYGQGDADAIDGNAHFYGWECVNSGSGKESWPTAQYMAMVKVQATICRAHKWGAKSVIGHREWSNQKVDPRGIDMSKFRADVAACLAQPAGKWGGTTTEPKLTLESLEKRVAALEAKVK